MAGRPNKSQSAGQSLIFCLRAGGGSTFLQDFSTVRDISCIRVTGYIFTTADNLRTPCPPGDPTKHEPTTCFNTQGRRLWLWTTNITQKCNIMQCFIILNIMHCIIVLNIMHCFIFLNIMHCFLIANIMHWGFWVIIWTTNKTLYELFVNDNTKCNENENYLYTNILQMYQIDTVITPITE